MPRPKAATHGRKIRASVTLDPDLYKWAMDRTGSGKDFASLSHAVNRGISALRDREKTK
jgi:Arc/MetJ-type ribon-helix-helix transcriptional regulator